MIAHQGRCWGHFEGSASSAWGTPNEILSQRKINELRDLVEYATRFHQDTNAAWETEQINAQELAGFAMRTLAFAR